MGEEKHFGCMAYQNMISYMAEKIEEQYYSFLDENIQISKILRSLILSFSRRKSTL